MGMLQACMGWRGWCGWLAAPQDALTAANSCGRAHEGSCAALHAALDVGRLCGTHVTFGASSTHGRAQRLLHGPYGVHGRHSPPPLCSTHAWALRRARQALTATFVLHPPAAECRRAGAAGCRSALAPRLAAAATSVSNRSH